jgi:uroporphyrinogen III methyltransferase/synthase
MSTSKKGKVYLVGAGPGDLGLVTLRAKECIENADVIVYDHLANQDMLAWARDDAEIIYAGKRAGEHSLSQSEINRLLVEKADAGKNVVRLKGGDPFVFGRGRKQSLMRKSNLRLCPGSRRRLPGRRMREFRSLIAGQILT